MAQEAFDFAAYMANKRAEIIEQGFSQAEILELIRQHLRGIKQQLGTYQKVQEPRRYAMTVEDIEEAERMYRQLSEDQGGIFEYDDYVDTLVNVNATMVVMTHVMEQFVKENPSPQPPAGKSGLGCAFALLVAGASTATLALALV